MLCNQDHLLCHSGERTVRAHHQGVSFLLATSSRNFPGNQCGVISRMDVKTGQLAASQGLEEQPMNGPLFQETGEATKLPRGSQKLK
jgi:hypothetical protein